MDFIGTHYDQFQIFDFDSGLILGQYIYGANYIWGASKIRIFIKQGWSDRFFISFNPKNTINKDLILNR